MTNLLYLRPGDSEETAGAWLVALRAQEMPSIILTSRYAVLQLGGKTRRDMVAKGAYVLEEDEEADALLIGVGAELSFAVEVARSVRESHGLHTRVLSFPCQRLFGRNLSSTNEIRSGCIGGFRRLLLNRMHRMVGRGMLVLQSV